MIPEEILANFFEKLVRCELEVLLEGIPAPSALGPEAALEGVLTVLLSTEVVAGLGKGGTPARA